MGEKLCNDEFYKLLESLYKEKLNNFVKLNNVVNNNLKQLEEDYLVCLKINKQADIVKDQQYYRFLYNQLLKKMSLYEKINWIYQK